jgi:hypothetical protein
MTVARYGLKRNFTARRVDGLYASDHWEPNWNGHMMTGISSMIIGYGVIDIVLGKYYVIVLTIGIKKNGGDLAIGQILYFGC